MKTKVLILLMLAGGCFGQVGSFNAKIDSLEYYTTDVDHMGEIVRLGITGNYYAVWHGEVTTNNGFITTFSCTPTGEIGASIIERYEWATGNLMRTSYAVDPMHVPKSQYCIWAVDQEAGRTMQVWSVNIDTTDGNIASSYTDIITPHYDTSTAYYPSIAKLTNTLYLMMYRDNSGHGQAVTFTVNPANGDLTQIEKYDFGPYGIASDCAAVRLGSSNYVLIAGRYGTSMQLTTLEINMSTGDIVSTVDQENGSYFDTPIDYSISIVPVDGDVYAIIYKNVTSNYTSVVTVDVDDADGSINTTRADRWNSALVNKSPPSHRAYKIPGTTVYSWGSTTSGDLVVNALSIANDGNISESWLCNQTIVQTIDAGFLGGAYFIGVTSDVAYFLIPTQSYDNDGWLWSYSINTSEGGWSHKVNGVLSPNKVSGVSGYSKVSGVE